MKKVLNVGMIVLVAIGATVQGQTVYAVESDPVMSYRTHVQTYGWQEYVSNGAMSGTEGQAKRLEGINIKLENQPYSGEIMYQTHVQTYGWQEWVEDGAMSGTEGEAKRLEGIRIQLTGEMAENYDVEYRTHVQTYGWQVWVKNGEVSGTEGQAKRLEGIQIRIVAKGETTPSSYMLDVPMISQLPELPTGCEITAVTMMLQYKGINVTKVQLAREMPKDASNPNKGYVGDPFSRSGWTIYPPALMGIVRKYSGSATDLTGQNFSAILAALQQEKPVVAWLTMHGFTVHAVTVTGFANGRVYYNDPWTGQKNANLSQVEFQKYWDSQSRRAISY